MLRRVPAQNLSDLVRDAAAATPDKAALLFHGETLTWAELDARVSAAARGLQALGAAPGDRVAIHLGNTPDFAVAYFGSLRAGCVALPVNTSYTADEVGHVLSDSGASIVLTGVATASLVSAPTVVVTASQQWRQLLADRTAMASVGGGEDLAVLLYTSGTSGRPKGAMLTHRALLANLEQAAQIDPPVVASDDIVLLVLPLFHVFGLNAALGSVARHGATGVLTERFDPVETLELVRRHGVTNVVGAPPMYVAWSMLPDVGDAFSSVRLALSGAAPLPPAVLHRVLDVTGHHVFEGYGLTETAPVLTTTLMSEVAKAGSIGRPVPGVELRLVDERGSLVEEGDPGEIIVRGANLFSGYWPDGADGPDADGWFATGDVAVLDDDGDLHLVDRRRELILVSGFNVYPREVEEVVATLDGVLEVAVLGIPHPYTGESVKALIVLEPGASMSADDVIAHCATSLARFKCPTAVSFVDELPHSATGKVSKGRLRELNP
ncbi:MAG: long-chain fatty-acid-CoA ligase [Frankiales bacterium]|nr:long-chain fatty-acid-CoA ligase [Frankiales bacterium]